MDAKGEQGDTRANHSITGFTLLKFTFQLNEAAGIAVSGVRFITPCYQMHEEGWTTVPIPNYETLMLPMLKYGDEGITSFRDAVLKASDDFQLSDEERKVTMPSGPEPFIRPRTGWAITYLVKANLLHRPKRAYFAITDKGKDVLADNPTAINRKYLEQFPEFVQFQKKKDFQVIRDSRIPRLQCYYPRGTNRGRL